MIHVGHEQRDGAACSTRLGNRDRGGINEGIVRCQTTLLIDEDRGLR